MIGRSSLLAFTLLTLTFSVGIGIVTAVFSLLNLSPNPASFFRLSAVATFPQYMALRDRVRSVHELAAWSAIPLSAPLGKDSAVPVQGTLVSCNFFNVIGVDKALAGGLLRADACYSAHTVVVISERLWRDRFSGDPAILGESLLYGDRPVTIIGVAAAPLADVWFPYTIQPYLKNSLTSSKDMDLLRADDIAWLNVAGRLQDGYSREDATEEFRSLASDQSIELSNGSSLPLSGLLAVGLTLPMLTLLVACINASVKFV